LIAEFSELAGRPVIIGGGAAGVATALALAPEPVVLLSKAPLGEIASSAWAQGGLAASLGEDDDPQLHFEDTIAAGDGLCRPEVVRAIVKAAPTAIETLAAIGVSFDRAFDGRFRLGLEAAHQRSRIVHAGGDGTGRELMRALVAAALRTPSITVLACFEARRLLVEDNAIVGVVVASPSGLTLLRSPRVVLATGGIGGLFDETTNPLGCFGQGLALGARAGAALADLEFIQFHPTALATAARPMKLISEAVRGDGATLVDELGQRFLSNEPGAELAPRDVVARAIWRRIAEGHRVFLDARRRPGAEFAARFPGITAACRAVGLDPARMPIPIRPAAHYHMGGIAVDAAGRSSVEGLWACGEVASIGLHGANRLASNSLIEAIVCAGWVAQSVASAPRALRKQATTSIIAAPPASDPSPVTHLFSRFLSIIRDRSGLREAISRLLVLVSENGPTSDPAIVGLMIAVAALQREESRGAHFRTDFPQRGSTARRSSLRLDEALDAARDLAIPSRSRAIAG
jgi:L-aspartate oxidase